MTAIKYQVGLDLDGGLKVRDIPNRATILDNLLVSTNGDLEHRSKSQVMSDLGVSHMEDGTAVGQMAYWGTGGWKHTEVSELYWDVGGSLTAASIISNGAVYVKNGSILYVDEMRPYTSSSMVIGAESTTLTFPGSTNTFTGSITAASINLTNLTTGYIPYDNGTSLVNSPIYTDGTNVGIGTTSPEAPLDFGASLGKKINLYAGQNFGIGIQANTLEFIVPSSNQDFKFGYGTTGSLTNLMTVKGTGDISVANNGAFGGTVTGTSANFGGVNLTETAPIFTTIATNGISGLRINVINAISPTTMLRFQYNSSSVITFTGAGAATFASSITAASINLTNLTTGYIPYDNGTSLVNSPIYCTSPTGNVGIGTTTGLSKLSINGGLHVGGDSDAGDNNLLVDGSITAASINLTNLTTGYIPYDNGTSLVNSPIYTDGTNVGIGTTSPASRLSVVGDMAIVTGMSITALKTNWDGGIYKSNAGGASYPFLSTHNLIIQGWSDGTNNRDIVFVAGATPDVKAVISGSTGNVGIGTTTGLSKLSINGGLHVGGDSDAGDDNLLVDGSITAASIYLKGTVQADIYLHDSGAVATKEVLHIVNAGGQTNFKVLDSSDYSVTYDDRIKISHSTGSVSLVGGKIVVNEAIDDVICNSNFSMWGGTNETRYINFLESGNIRASVYFDTSADKLVIDSYTTLSVLSNTTVTGTLTSTGDISVANNGAFGGTVTAVDHINTSDRRKKDYIATIEDGLSIALALNPVRHTWKNDKTNKLQYGFIYDEVLEVASPLAKMGVDGFGGVSYGKMSVIAISAIQGVHKEIHTMIIPKLTEHEEEIIKLKDRITELELQIGN